MSDSLTADPETASGAPQRQRSKDNSRETQYGFLRRALLEALAKAPDYAFTTPELLTAAEVVVTDRKLANSILSRLARSRQVQRLSRGVYRHRDRGSLARSHPDVSYHGAHLALSNRAPSPRLAAALTTLDNASTAHDGQANGKATLRVPLGKAREALIQVSGSLEVRIACGDNPMSAEMLYAVLWTLDGTYGLSFTTEPWQVVRIEANKDHIGLTLDGASAVTVNLGAFLLRGYDRPGILRQEVVSLHPAPLSEFLEQLNGEGAAGIAQLQEAVQTLNKEYALHRRTEDALLVELAERRKRRQNRRKDSGSTTD